MATKISQIQDYTGYIKCGEILKSPSANNQYSFILKCFECHEISFILESFIQHIQGHSNRLTLQKENEHLVQEGETRDQNVGMSLIKEELIIMDVEDPLVIVKQEQEEIAKPTKAELEAESNKLEKDHYYQHNSSNTDEDFNTDDGEECGEDKMDSKIKMMPFYASNSNTEYNSCENCKQLSRKIDYLQESVSNLYKIIQQQNEAIMSAFAEIKVVTTKLVRQEETSVAGVINYFPLKSDQMLQNIDNQINDHTHDLYVSLMSKLWRSSVSRNLENILDRKIVLGYNLDGSHGKQKLKQYKNFYKALLESIERLPYLGQKVPEMVLRRAMQLTKKKQFRENRHSIKKEEEKEHKEKDNSKLEAN